MTRRIIAATTALIVALVGAVAVVAYARAADTRALAGQEAVRVYVARQEVPAGTRAGQAVEDGLIVQELIARKAVPDGALTTVDNGYDQLVASSAIQPGELVLRTRFSPRATTDGALFVPDGKLAISLALDDPSHVGPFVVVGSKISVFDTFNVQEKAAGDATPAGDRLQDRHEYRRATRLLLPSVEVLAVGASTTAIKAPAADDTAKSGLAVGDQQATTLFTVAVTQAEAERLIHASRTGTLTFALLGTGSRTTEGPGTDDVTLFGGAR